MDASNNVTSSYLDFSGLGELRGRAAKDGQGALRETAEQFEALFIQMMMKSMREATFKSDMLQSDALDTYQDMFDKEISVSMAARGNMGLADMLQGQLSNESARLSPSSALDAVDAPRPLHQEQAPMSLPNNAGSANASGNSLPLGGYAVGQPMPMPSHWTRQTAKPDADVNAAAQRPLNNAGDGYADLDTSISTGAGTRTTGGAL